MRVRSDNGGIAGGPRPALRIVPGATRLQPDVVLLVDRSTPLLGLPPQGMLNLGLT
jgi:hypothetical protein